MPSVRLLTNGKLLLRTAALRGSHLRWREFASVGSKPFCVESYRNVSASNSAAREDLMAISICTQTADSGSESEERKRLHHVFLIYVHVLIPVVYFPCILIYFGILLVYIILWDKHSEHGWTIVALSVSQLTFYTVEGLTVGLVLYTDSIVDQQSFQYFCGALGKLLPWKELEVEAVF